MGWYYHPEPVAPPGSIVCTDDGEGHHMARVARVKAGDSVTLFDGKGGTAECIVRSVKGTAVEMEVLRSRQCGPPAGPSLDVGVGLVSLDRVKQALYGVTAAGIRSFLPLVCERTQKGGRRAAHPRKLIDTLSRTAIAACKQAECPIAPHVLRPVTVFEALDKARGGNILPLFATTLHEALPLRDALDDVRNRPVPGGILLLTGPEGGFTDEEYLLGRDVGARFVRFAPYIYRTEDAACAFAAAVRSTLGW